jgi:hypothetical protein
MSPEDYNKRVNKLTESRINFFDSATSKAQNDSYNLIISRIKDFDLDASGNIKATQANIKRLSRLRTDLQGLIVTDTYVERVNTFTSSFDSLKGINDNYFRAISATFTPNKAVYEAITSNAIKDTANSLLGAGIDSRVIEPIEKILTDSVLNGYSFNDVVNNIRIQVIGTDEALGSLDRYVKQITTDSLNQYNASYTQRISSDLGLEFYLYLGGLKETSRSYCITRANKYFHIKEIQKVPDSWAGMVKGTDSSNILTYRGGYNCGHHYIPTLIDIVPNDVVERARAKGFIT